MGLISLLLCCAVSLGVMLTPGMSPSAAALEEGASPNCGGISTRAGDATWGYSAEYVCAWNLGIVGNWNSNDFYLQPSQYSAGDGMTHEMWDITDTNGTFIELGLINDNDYAAGFSDDCNFNGVAYQVFWAESSDYGLVYRFHCLQNISPNGGPIIYSVTSNNNGSNQWTIGLDFQPVATTSYQSSAIGWLSAAGLEYNFGGDNSVLSPGDYSATFDQYLQENIEGNWDRLPLSWWDVSTPCGTGPGRYPNGYCANGVGWSASEWSSNVPD